MSNMTNFEYSVDVSNTLTGNLVHFPCAQRLSKDADSVGCEITLVPGVNGGTEDAKVPSSIPFHLRHSWLEHIIT